MCFDHHSEDNMMGPKPIDLEKQFDLLFAALKLWPKTTPGHHMLAGAFFEAHELAPGLVVPDGEDSEIKCLKSASRLRLLLSYIALGWDYIKSPPAVALTFAVCLECPWGRSSAVI